LVYESVAEAYFMGFSMMIPFFFASFLVFDVLINNFFGH